MTRFAVTILPAAEAEVREAFLWYSERSPIAAAAFRAETLETIDRLSVDVWLLAEKPPPRKTPTLRK